MVDLILKVMVRNWIEFGMFFVSVWMAVVSVRSSGTLGAWEVFWILFAVALFIKGIRLINQAMDEGY